jgi:hypothetical protein
MPRAITAASIMTCQHGGQVIGTPGAPKVMLGGAPVLTSVDTFVIIGCPLVIALVPSPCLTVQWTKVDLKTQTGGGSTLSEASVGLCINALGVPQGTVIVTGAAPQGQTV